MKVAKTLSIDAELLVEIIKMTGEDGLSSFVEDALRAKIEEEKQKVE